MRITCPALSLAVAVLLCVTQITLAQFNIGGVTISILKHSGKPKTNVSASPKQNALVQASSVSNQTDAISEDVEINPKAPADYDPNLNVGNQAVAVPHFTELRRVKILAKSGGNYKTIDLDDSRLVRWFKANSVYPYFDTRAFGK